MALIARDGYTATVPVSRFLSHKAWFAFAREDRREGRQPEMSLERAREDHVLMEMVRGG